LVIATDIKSLTGLSKHQFLPIAVGTAGNNKIPFASTSVLIRLIRAIRVPFPIKKSASSAGTMSPASKSVLIRLIRAIRVPFLS
jgi:hypothetical protein